MNRSPCTTQRKRTMERTAGRMRFSAVAVASAVVLAAFHANPPAWAATYRWTDANGRVVYSDQRPPGDIKVDTIAGPPPPTNPNAAKDLAGKEAEGKKQEKDAAASAKKAAQQRADAEKRSSDCREARAEITRLTADQVLLYRINEKGETVFMNDTDRRQRRETLENYVKANCAQG